MSRTSTKASAALSKRRQANTSDHGFQLGEQLKELDACWATADLAINRAKLAKRIANGYSVCGNQFSGQNFHEVRRTGKSPKVVCIVPDAYVDAVRFFFFKEESFVQALCIGWDEIVDENPADYDVLVPMERAIWRTVSYMDKCRAKWIAQAVSQWGAVGDSATRIPSDGRVPLLDAWLRREWYEYQDPASRRAVSTDTLLALGDPLRLDWRAWAEEREVRAVYYGEELDDGSLSEPQGYADFIRSHIDTVLAVRKEGRGKAPRQAPSTRPTEDDDDGEDEMDVDPEESVPKKSPAKGKGKGKRPRTSGVSEVAPPKKAPRAARSRAKNTQEMDLDESDGAASVRMALASEQERNRAMVGQGDAAAAPNAPPNAPRLDQVDALSLGGARPASEGGLSDRDGAGSPDATSGAMGNEEAGGENEGEQHGVSQASVGLGQEVVGTQGTEAGGEGEEGGVGAKEMEAEGEQEGGATEGEPKRSGPAREDVETARACLGDSSTQPQPTQSTLASSEGTLDVSQAIPQPVEAVPPTQSSQAPSQPSQPLQRIEGATQTTQETPASPSSSDDDGYPTTKVSMERWKRPNPSTLVSRAAMGIHDTSDQGALLSTSAVIPNAGPSAGKLPGHASPTPQAPASVPSVSEWNEDQMSLDTPWALGDDDVPQASPHTPENATRPASPLNPALRQRGRPRGSTASARGTLTEPVTRELRPRDAPHPIPRDPVALSPSPSPPPILSSLFGVYGDALDPPEERAGAAYAIQHENVPRRDGMETDPDSTDEEIGNLSQLSISGAAAQEGWGKASELRELMDQSRVAIRGEKAQHGKTVAAVKALLAIERMFPGGVAEFEDVVLEIATQEDDWRELMACFGTIYGAIKSPKNKDKGKGKEKAKEKANNIAKFDEAKALCKAYGKVVISAGTLKGYETGTGREQSVSSGVSK
ncbi:hypothetical protein BOTBODRAFT_182397 [Botryobasidium botryosum FD-172 SS1]|uniref:Uncharacterized protein n=1 Tax=Botryobasidium botryosum (strain FD-172 SS1) TaxID=930990 RepID=A0A067M141_BOTB1|nr:hypothetical protein BOTBODRAFT_182397 [Botryobasidium botryosum FD-172 SS1]